MTIFDRSTCFALLRALFDRVGTDRLASMADLPFVVPAVYGGFSEEVKGFANIDVQALQAIGLIEVFLVPGEPENSEARYIRVTDDGELVVRVLTGGVA